MTYKSGDIFTLEQVMKLNLPDSPFLMVAIRGGDWCAKRHPIQTSHFCLEELEGTELGGTRWKYSYTTNEMCPIFYAQDKVCHLLDVQPYTCAYAPREGVNVMLTPKGFPRKLHHSEVPVKAPWFEVVR